MAFLQQSVMFPVLSTRTSKKPELFCSNMFRKIINIFPRNMGQSITPTCRWFRSWNAKFYLHHLSPGCQMLVDASSTRSFPYDRGSMVFTWGSPASPPDWQPQPQNPKFLGTWGLWQQLRTFNWKLFPSKSVWSTEQITEKPAAHGAFPLNRKVVNFQNLTSDSRKAADSSVVVPNKTVNETFQQSFNHLKFHSALPNKTCANLCPCWNWPATQKMAVTKNNVWLDVLFQKITGGFSLPFTFTSCAKDFVWLLATQELEHRNTVQLTSCLK